MEPKPKVQEHRTYTPKPRPGTTSDRRFSLEGLCVTLVTCVRFSEVGQNDTQHEKLVEHFIKGLGVCVCVTL